jgi:tight adherence protein B
MFLAVLVFLLVVAVVFGGYAAVTYLPGMLAERRLTQRLKDVSGVPDALPGEDESVLKRTTRGALPAVDRLIAGTRGGSWLAKAIEQSGVKTSPGGLVAVSLALAAAAWIVTQLFTRQWFLGLPAGVLASSIPMIYLLNRRGARMRLFEEHFPEALDLIARAIRAGHAFQTALGMVAEEMDEPLGPEFKKTFDHQNFGLPLRDALAQLAERVPILDVRFFITAVLIQRDTGGNLSEILDNLGHVVRERFKIRRQVRVHTAHGRFTAFVLLSLPAFLGLALTMLNPEHMAPLFHEHLGQMMLIGALVMQAIGFFWIRKIIKIEV